MVCSPHRISFRVIQLRRLRWAGDVARTEERKSSRRILVGKPEGRKPIRTARPRWGDNIKKDLREIFWGHVLNPSGSG
jgi:hypothetical protein